LHSNTSTVLENEQMAQLGTPVMTFGVERTQNALHCDFLYEGGIARGFHLTPPNCPAEHLLGGWQE